MESPHTPRQTLRMDQDLWEKLGDYAAPDSRAEVMRQFARWYTWEPGAKMPRRKPKAES